MDIYHSVLYKDFLPFCSASVFLEHQKCFINWISLKSFDPSFKVHLGLREDTGQCYIKFLHFQAERLEDYLANLRQSQLAAANSLLSAKITFS